MKKLNILLLILTILLCFKIFVIKKIIEPQKIIAFSYFGNKEKFLIGLLRNVRIIPEIYGPDYMIRIYTDEVIKEVEHLPYVQVILVQGESVFGIPLENIAPTVWRFLPILDPNVIEFHSRDLDSLPSIREWKAVEEFVNSNAIFHIMRDNRAHSAPILAGMWGGKPQENHRFLQALMKPLFLSALESPDRYTDQILLAKHVFPYINGKTLAHDSYNCVQLRTNETKGFPSERLEEPMNFVGSVQDYFAEPMMQVCPPPCRRNPDWKYC